MSKFLIVTAGKTIWTRNFIDLAEARGLDYLVIDVRNLLIQTGKEIITNYPEAKDSQFGVFFPEMYEQYHHYVSLLFTHVNFLNGETIKKFPGLSDKFLQSILVNSLLPDSGISFPNSYHSINPNLLANLKLSFPYLIKKARSFSGKGITKIKTETSFWQHYGMSDSSKYLIQEITARNEEGFTDYRTIVLDGVVVGTVKRTNSSLITTGGTQKQVDLDPAVAEKLLKVVAALSLELVAFDYTLNGNDVILYEMNRFPYFQKFIATTGIDVNNLILEHLISNYQK